FTLWRLRGVPARRRLDRRCPGRPHSRAAPALIPSRSHPVIPRLRWWIGGLLFASTVVNYIDRQTLSVLAPFLKSEYHWTNSDFALLIISFRVAYAVMPRSEEHTSELQSLTN